MAENIGIVILHFIALLALYFFTAKVIVPRIYERAITYYHNLIFSENPPEPEPQVREKIQDQPEIPETLGQKLHQAAMQEKQDEKVGDKPPENRELYD